MKAVPQVLGWHQKEETRVAVQYPTHDEGEPGEMGVPTFLIDKGQPNEGVTP